MSEVCLDLECNMEHIHEFFDTTSINGITFIKKSKGLARLFWILVVIAGFSGAVFMLNESFKNWRNNPISTTEETKRISDITFPNVTICPPNIILNLNHDIKDAEAVRLNDDIRDELIDFALDVIEIKFYDDMMANLSKIEDPDRYYNWYHDYDELSVSPFPTIDTHDNGDGIFTYSMKYLGMSGNFSTQYFGEKFDVDKVEANILYRITIDTTRIRKALKNIKTNQHHTFLSFNFFKFFFRVKGVFTVLRSKIPLKLMSFFSSFKLLIWELWTVHYSPQGINFQASMLENSMMD